MHLMYRNGKIVMSTKKLSGKVTLVTGASRGLGKEIAIHLAIAGATVIINYKSNAASAEELVDHIKKMGGNAVALQADVSLEADVNEMFSKIFKDLGYVDILVNNAGINPTFSLEDITFSDFQNCVNINLNSAFLTSQAVIPHMKKQKYGRIINISSIAAQTGGVIGPHYAASKAAMIGLTHSYAKLLAESGVTVNAVAPALIETDMIKDNPSITPDLIPVKRFGQPDEVASVVLLLVDNGYITGQTFNVNGGWYMS
ncbi:3-oxoacyl-[acyl-carrier protein] reductase [Chryseobacterium arachidis]|uniref:3-oxoacyl-[acyl-carrier protein] reductase n=2 Tax=Chryseobacterium arachidis TaxID=1416778 RepID=A0A1M5MF60_9FLAO|nr:3-oxoacyl-[acyl-carrier protein] reductase [Chryseobacterium arachidis]